MRKIRILILFLLCSTAVLAQNEVKAEELFQSADYSAAQQEYGLLLQRYPTSALYNYRYARCAQELGEYEVAIRHFNKSGNRYQLKHFNLGECYLQIAHPEQAITSYNTYLKSSKLESEREQYVRERIQQAEKMQRYMRRVEKVEIIDSVETSVDSILAYCPLSSEAGTMAYDEKGNVVYTNQRRDRKLWGTAHETSSVILSSHNLMGQWSAPDTLPQEVNMASQQAYPYVLSDGVTLYFAVCDTSGLGGYDIYVTRYNTYTEAYTAPENVGMPFNSMGNDYLMLIDEHRNIGYFATDRFSPEGRVRIYSFVPTLQKTYWRGLSTDSLAAYAQLRYVLPVQQTTLVEMAGFEPASKLNTIQAEQPKEEIFFVLNDSVVYTDLSHFRHTEALKKYQEWENLQKQADYDTQLLSTLRQSYGEADEEEREQLAPSIIQLENKQSQSLQRCQNLLQEIRQIEMSAQ